MEESYGIDLSLLEASLASGHLCFGCNNSIFPENVFIVSITIPNKDTLYIHDDPCFDSFIEWLNLFDSMRSKMRREDKVN